MEHPDRKQASSSGDSPSRRRRAVWASALAVLLALGAWTVWSAVSGTEGTPGSLGRENRMPNVLLITLDTTRADGLGCYGNLANHTPNTDRIASEGTLFAQCSTCSPLTLPSHSSMMTATYPYVHGVRQNGTYRLTQGHVTLAEVLKQAGCTTGAVVASFVLNRRFGLDQGFDTYRDVEVGDSPIPMGAQHKGDRVCDDALELLRSAASSRFFLWVHFYDPHFPYVTLERRHSPDAYHEEIAFMDGQVGRLMDELTRLGIDRTTLVVVAGDHGEALNQHDEMFHGFFLYQTTLRVPLIIRYPGVVPAGRRVDARVRTIDIAPTILDLASCPPLKVSQGVSLVPLMSGRVEDLGLAAYAEATDSLTQMTLSPLRSLTVGRWKYLLAPRPELYDLDSDPGEQENLATQHAGRAADMRERLRELIAQAPPPPTSGDSSVRLDKDDLANLESLGYVASGADAGADGLSELERFEPRGGDPKDHTAVLRANAVGTGMLFEGEYATAERVLRQVVDALPDAAGPLANLANAIHMQWRLDEAAPLYERVLAGATENHLVRRRYAGLCVDARRWNDAIEQLSILLAAYPDDAEVHYNMAVALGSVGRFAESIAHLEQARSINPEDVRYLHGMAITYAQQNELDKAAECLRKALEIDPSQERLREDLRKMLHLIEQRRQSDNPTSQPAQSRSD